MCFKPNQLTTTKPRTRPDTAHLRRRGGFSLVEMMVVLVLVGLLASVVTVNVRGLMIKGKQNAARAQIRQFVNGLNDYYMSNGQYPSNDQGLGVLVERDEKTNERIIDSQIIPKDPWGNDYQYNAPGRDNEPYEVICFGADGRSGGEGADRDIASFDADES